MLIIKVEYENINIGLGSMIFLVGCSIVFGLFVIGSKIFNLLLLLVLFIVLFWCWFLIFNFIGFLWILRLN
ncbi:protein of unknown function [Alcaligenes faecalis subsp. faecalis]|nr:protein of unknown function [Alcaligenes faecalis subsp. faecalis]